MIRVGFVYEFFHHYLLEPKILALVITLFVLTSLFKGAIIHLANFKNFKKSLLIGFLSNFLAIISIGLVFFFNVFLTDQFIILFSIIVGFVILLDIILITIFKGKSSWFSGFLGVILYNLLLFSGISIAILLSLLS